MFFRTLWKLPAICKKMIVSCSLSKCCLKNWFSYRELFLKHMAYGKFSFTVDIGYELDHFGFKGKYFLVSFNLIISHWCTFCFYGNSYCQFYLEYIYLTPMSNLWRVLGESTRLYTDFFVYFSYNLRKVRNKIYSVS